MLRPLPAGRAGPCSPGAYRLSKRQIQQLAADLFGLSISTGMISKLERQSAAVLEAPYNELAVAVHHAEVANIDETSWRERPEGLVVGDGDRARSPSSPSPGRRSGEVAQALLGSEVGPGRQQRPVQRV